MNGACDSSKAEQLAGHEAVASPTHPSPCCKSTCQDETALMANHGAMQQLNRFATR